MLEWLRRWWHKAQEAPPAGERPMVLLPPATMVDAPIQPKESTAHAPKAAARTEAIEMPPVETVSFTLAAEVIQTVPEVTPADTSGAAPSSSPVPQPALAVVAESKPALPAIDWRGPGYLLPGGYALRWGFQPLLRPRAVLALAAALPGTMQAATSKAPAAPSPTRLSTISTLSPLAFLANIPAPDVPPAGTRIDPVTFTEFLLVREEEATTAAARYWTDRAVYGAASGLMDRLLARRDEHQPPLTTAEFLEEALRQASGAALALLVCHNVARAFARGSTILNWRRVDASRGVYQRGDRPYQAAATGQSYFYQLFNPQSLGAADPGDWYRFFGVAAATAFASSAALEPAPAPVPGVAVRQVDSIARQLLQSESSTDPRSAALAWVNAIRFWEWGIYSRSIDLTRRSARQGQEAFQFGLHAVALEGQGPWHWHVPKPASWNENETRIDLAQTRLEVEEFAHA